MTRFDSRLRRALMDANLAQYQRTLQGVESWDPDFSPGYLRERMRLLADPQGWGHRQDRPGGRRRRLNWQLIAILAALLLLSACAYAAVTGQFSRWFPRRGVDPKAPETSEEVLSGTGTVIGQSVTLGDETVTLNAALWDGSRVWISLELESPRIPEEIRPHDWLEAGACSLSLRQDQWEAYTRSTWEEFYASEEPDMPPERLEAEIQARLAEEPIRRLHFEVLARGENALTLESTSPLIANLFPAEEQPEITLHLENLAASTDSEDGSSQETIILKGPFTFTFTLDRPALALSIRYDAAGAELPALDVPFRFTGFELSTTGLTAAYTAQDPKNLPGPREVRALMDSLRGLWTEDGTYVDLTEAGGSGSNTSVTCDYPYPIDPAAVTALDLCGVRVELSGLERLEG